jgi:hypothetical protein
MLGLKKLRSKHGNADGTTLKEGSTSDASVADEKRRV